MENARQEADDAEVPKDLGDKIRKRLDEDQSLPWDEALTDIIRESADTEDL